MDYIYNTTNTYHVSQISTLGWELTISNALEPAETPVRAVLARNDTFGHLLFDHLRKHIPVEKVSSVLEIGGGYGYLMRDFLERKGDLRPTMLDISPFLLDRQRETLKGYTVSYREEDFFNADPIMLKGFDLVLMNENLGDFPTLVNLPADLLKPGFIPDDPILETALRLFQDYHFEEALALNVGAVLALERLCACGVPYVYLGEHSCESVSPKEFGGLIRIEQTGCPERVMLKGHDEYTIKFSNLQKVAESFGYSFVRGPFADFISLNISTELKNIIASGGLYSDREEIICQFVEDLYKYEYLILIKE